MRILLFHWNEPEALERTNVLMAAGHEVRAVSDGMKVRLREIDEFAPEVVVIDLRRLPSHGRSIATTLRERKSTRAVPLVFVEGDEAKTERIRELLPDATFTPWSRIRSAIRAAASIPRAAPPVIPRSDQGYSGKPLPQKLGIKPETTLLLMGPPDRFDVTLGPLPDGVTVRSRAGGSAETVVLFVRGRAELARRLSTALRALGPKGALWVAWPKKTSGVATDLVEDGVREHAFPLGLVDVKVCAIDAIWSGLCLRRRVKK